MINVTCSSCGINLKIEDKYAGMAGRCKQCGSKVVVPENVANLKKENEASKLKDLKSPLPPGVPPPPPPPALSNNGVDI